MAEFEWSKTVCKHEYGPSEYVVCCVDYPYCGHEYSVEISKCRLCGDERRRRDDGAARAAAVQPSPEVNLQQDDRPTDDKILAAVSSGDTRLAILLYREAYGGGLKEANEFVRGLLK